MIEAVIFDVEGTLIDCASLTLRCWQTTLSAYGYEFSTTRLHAFSGADPKIMLAALVPEILSNTGDQIIKENGERYRADFLPKAHPFPQLDVLFEKLSKHGYKTAVATTAERGELEYYLKLLDIDRFIAVHLCGDDVDREKPSADLIQKAISRLHVPATRTVVVGDTPFDAIAAKGAGAASIGVLTGGFTKQELAEARCVDSIPAAAHLFDRLVHLGNNQGGAGMTENEELLLARVTALELLCSQMLSLIMAQQIGKTGNAKADAESGIKHLNELLASNLAKLDDLPGVDEVGVTMTRVIRNAGRDIWKFQKVLNGVEKTDADSESQE
jgi:phosphoglycolate phosphatase-like HAD superfamily hydrolase